MRNGLLGTRRLDTVASCASASAVGQLESAAAAPYSRNARRDSRLVMFAPSRIASGWGERRVRRTACGYDKAQAAHDHTDSNGHEAGSVAETEQQCACDR